VGRPDSYTTAAGTVNRAAASAEIGLLAASWSASRPLQASRQTGVNIMTTISIPTLSTQRLVLDGLETLTRDGVARIVKTAAAVAGLAGNYASHSLRAGFVTDALDAGASREQVQRHRRWSNIRSIDPYDRKTEVWAATTPSQRLAGS
jgi:hypothetical protein